MDDPAPREARRYVGSKARILEVPLNQDYNFQQAWVRRKGFLEAEHDRILSVDDDLQLTSNVLLALRELGNGVGLCSLSKFVVPHSIADLIRLFSLTVAHKVNPTGTTFTGLYALDRRCWLETNDLETVKSLYNPKDPAVQYPLSGMGEDTWLCNRMIDSPYATHYRREIGAYDHGTPHHLSPKVQFEYGRWFGATGMTFQHIWVKAMMYMKPDLVRGWLDYRRHPERLRAGTKEEVTKAEYYIERRHA